MSASKLVRTVRESSHAHPAPTASPCSCIPSLQYENHEFRGTERKSPSSERRSRACLVSFKSTFPKRFSVNPSQGLGWFAPAFLPALCAETPPLLALSKTLKCSMAVVFRRNSLGNLRRCVFSCKAGVFYLLKKLQAKLMQEAADDRRSSTNWIASVSQTAKVNAVHCRSGDRLLQDAQASNAALTKVHTRRSIRDV